MTSSGLSDVVAGVPALDVLTISTEPSFLRTSQVQPAPKLPRALLVNSALKLSRLPHFLLMASGDKRQREKRRDANKQRLTGKSSVGVASAVRLHAAPEEGVVPHLGRVVEDAARRRLGDNVLQRQAVGKEKSSHHRKHAHHRAYRSYSVPLMRLFRFVT